MKNILKITMIVAVVSSLYSCSPKQEQAENQKAEDTMTTVETPAAPATVDTAKTEAAPVDTAAAAKEEVKK